MKTDTRALAAKGLAEIALRGASLRDVMERHAPRLADPRDRALLMALLSEGARWWLRFDAAIDGLLEKPLRHKDPAIHALLAPAQAEFDRAQAGDHFLKILHAGAGPRFQASRDLARFMLEGLARTTLTYDKDGRKERLLMLIKRATHMLNRKGDVQDLWPE